LDSKVLDPKEWEEKQESEEWVEGRILYRSNRKLFWPKLGKQWK
jgi:hypothetical protein